MKRCFLPAITVAAGLLFNSCEKEYPDGPRFSLRSPESRIDNEWKVAEYYKNGLDDIAGFNSKKAGYMETYSEDGSWTFSYTDENGTPVSGGGTWYFIEGSDNTMLYRRWGAYQQNVEEVHISRLKNKEYWYWIVDYSGTKHEFRLEEK